jgi:hypothetical protein
MGLSQGEKTRRIAGYESLIEKQNTAMQSGAGGVMVDEGNMYKALVDQGTVMGLPEPDQYWQDPARPSGQPNPQTGQMMSVAEASGMAKQREQQAAMAAQNAQTDKMLALQSQIATLQEETKRLKIISDGTSDAQATVQKGVDSMRDYTVDMTKIEQESGEDLPGGVLYGDDDLAVRLVQ